MNRILATLLLFGVVSTSAEICVAQNTQVINSLGDGDFLEIPLNISEIGKEYAIIVELQGKSAVTATVAMSGPAGIVGKLYTTQVPASTDVNSLEMNPLYWNLSQVRYQNGNFKDQVITGEPPEESGGVRYSCPTFFGPAELDYILSQMAQVWPGLTKQQLCDILKAQLGIVNSIDNGEAAMASDGVTPLARGVIYKDSCSEKYKTVVQLRINPTGLPFYEYGFGNVLRVSLKLKAHSAGDPVRWRYKKSDGRDAPAWILLTQAIGAAQSQKYGALGTDRILSQTWKNGKPKTKKFTSRILYGPTLFMISKGHASDKKKRTLVVQNGDQVYSFCFPHKKVSSCTKAYAKKMKIKCGPPK